PPRWRQRRTTGIAGPDLRPARTRSGMTERPTPRPERPDRPNAEPYEIRLTGCIDAHWTSWFDGLTVTRETDGTTVIRGLVADQAALHGLLQRVRDLGLPRLSVSRVEADRPTTTTAREAGSNPTTTRSVTR